MRTIMSGLNTVVALGEPGRGGATQEYLVQAGSKSFELSFMSDSEAGLTNEALLSILIDRLRGFQGGDYACEENAIALRGCEEALLALTRRENRRSNGI